MPSFSLDNATVYDIETFPNCFTFAMEMLNSNTKGVWEISEYRNDKEQLLQFFQWLADSQAAMIGFNNINFDYPVIHLLRTNPSVGYQELYAKAMEIIKGGDRFGHLVWERDRFAPQIDLFKLYHFDNRAKSTSLKALEINMRSDSVVDMPVENGKILTKAEIDQYLIPYNAWDVTNTKRFANFSMDAINFRIGLIDQFGADVLNWNDTKIGEQTVIQRLGDEICYDRSSGKRKTRQTPRTEIPIKDIIFPYVKLEHPEFKRIYDYLSSQVLRADDFESFSEDTPLIKTKGVFKDLTATVNGFTFHYGVGGIHGSVEKKRVEATQDWFIRDIDVASLYPSIAIANKLAPEHLGAEFVRVYSDLPKERKKWQIEKGKKCVEANSLKLASNGVYGKSNSVFSPFFDPKFTMTVTINGQLMLSMLAEKLLKIPTLQILQINTDGITYFIHRDHEDEAATVCKSWEQLTGLVLESANYKRLFMKDVNNYLGESFDGSLKLKGAYWTPDPTDYHASISASQPPAWHKNFSNVVSTRAAVAHMVHGVDVEGFIRACLNPFDFMCAVKIRRSDNLIWGSKQVQRNTRFYISTDGSNLIKQSPPTGRIGSFKKANGISDANYARIMKETGGEWDERVCTKNKSTYQIRENAIAAGYKVTVCNDVKDFSFNNINYDWYINEALKLCI